MEIETTRAISCCRATALFWLWSRRWPKWPAASWKGCSSDISSGCKSAWATVERWPWWGPVSWLPVKRSFASAAEIVAVVGQTYLLKCLYFLYKKLFYSCCRRRRSRSQESPRELSPFAVFFREHCLFGGDLDLPNLSKPGGAKQAHVGEGM